MNKLIVSLLATLTLGASFSVLADDSMKGMDMNSMHGMDMGKMSMKPAESKVAHGVGVITSIDTTTDMIVLNHQAIKELNWPPMKMGFKVADHKLLDGLKAGQKVNFDLKAEGTKQVVTSIAVAK